MIYVFEDDERDPIPKLFMSCYSGSILSNFVYTRGNGNIYNKVESLLTRKDMIVVYLDTIPGNLETRRLYVKLSRLSRKNDKNIVVLPILGSEYYFIKSIQYKNVITDRESVGVCVSDKAYFKSSVISTLEDKAYCKYYERFCKLVLQKSVIDCVRNSEDNGRNAHFRWYYDRDCRCAESLDGCMEEDVLRKSKDLLCAYPCVPCYRTECSDSQLDMLNVWDIHRQLVDKHNRLCDELAENDPDRTRATAYKYISYI